MMSVENALQFVRQVCLDNTLKARMEAAASPDHVVSLARELGYEVSVDELRTVTDKFKEEELSDFKLESVAGGVNLAIIDRFKAIVR